MVSSRFAPSYTVPQTPVLAPLGAAVEANRRKERQLEAHIDSLSTSIEHIEDALVRTEAKAKRFADAGGAAGAGAATAATMSLSPTRRHHMSPAPRYISPVKPVSYMTPSRAVLVSESEVNALHDTVRANQRRIQELTNELSGTYHEVRNEADAMEASFQRRRATEAQAEAQAEHRRAVAASGEVNALRQDLLTTRQQLDTTAANLLASQRELLHAREQWNREANELRVRVEDAESRLNGANALVASAKVREGSLSSEVAALQKREEHFKSAWDELQRLKQRISDYDAKHAEDSRSMREAERIHESEMRATREHLARVTADLDTARQKGSEAHAFVQELETRLQEARAALVEARSAAEGTRATGREHEARILEQDALIREQSITITTLEDRLASEGNQVRELNNRLLEIESRMRENEIRAVDLESSLNRARSDHESDRSHLLRELEAERNSAHDQHRILTADVDSFRTRASVAEADLEIVQRKLKDALSSFDDERRLRHTAENNAQDWESRCRDLEDQANRVVMAGGGRYVPPRAYIRPAPLPAPLPAPPSLALLREAERILDTKRAADNAEDSDKASLAMALVDAAMGLAQTAPKSPARRTAPPPSRPLGNRLDARFDKLGTSIKRLDDKFKGFQSSASRTYETSAARAASRHVSWNDVESRANEFARVAHSAQGY